jgi:Fe-S-cluster containining protein
MSLIYNPSTVGKLLKLQEKANRLEEISPLLFRDNNCVDNCAGCCMKFSLVFWGDRWEKFKSLHPEEVSNYTEVVLNGVSVWEDKQPENSDYYCKHLNKTNGRCNIHFTQKPLHCEMEPMAFSDGFLTKRPFKEAHLMPTLQGKGALCYMGEIDNKVRLTDVRLLKELNVVLKSTNLTTLIGELEDKIL